MKMGILRKKGAGKGNKENQPLGVVLD